MNKQELEKQAEALYTDVRSFLDNTFELIDQIHEPQKVVVPKFVAEWYDHAKQQNFTLSSALEHWSMSEELEKWFQYSYNQETFARAWLDSYEVEMEKLYTVEIPNPNNRFSVVFLTKEKGRVHIGTGAFSGNTPDDKWKKDPNTHLTESEIKQDFEWAWEWAEPVEVE
ncbi:DUF1642 domain-containing protein [Streptococcus suis]|uniref:DUF1642 domain-containing protein n=1 Tax=Streptococcus suis TaxID=1307 RepID=UPI0013795D7F|nr:DUF1642 domain-containing protein [Streptococcus suis]